MPAPLATVGVSYALAYLLAGTLVILLAGLAVAVVHYRREPRRDRAVAVVGLAIALAVVGAVLGYGAYETYRMQNTWYFDYYVSVQSNRSDAGTVIVPVPSDAGLLAGLRLLAGSANWSLTDTALGRGLYVSFVGSAVLDASVSLFPAPAAPPDAAPTLIHSDNCTAQPTNCTGLPRAWVYYGGSGGAHLDLSFGTVHVTGYLEAGWAPYVNAPPPMAVA